MHDMNNFKLITKLSLIKYQHKHRLIITSYIITQIPLMLISNTDIKGEDLGQEKKFWFCKLSILHTLLAEGKFSWLRLSLTNYSPPPLPLSSSLNILNSKGTTGG